MSESEQNGVETPTETTTPTVNGNHETENPGKENAENPGKENGVEEEHKEGAEGGAAVLGNGEKRNGVDEEDGPEKKKPKLAEDKVNGETKEEEIKVKEDKTKDKKEEEKENKKVVNEKEKDFNLFANASTVTKSVAEKCAECEYKCWTDAEMRVHCMTSHGSAPRRKRMCGNCNFTCTNTWEMDFHTKSRGHKAKVVITCKKCDYLCETKEETWEHKKVHIPADSLFECGDCYWCGDRLDNIRYHVHSQEHKMKFDYEAVAKAKAATKGPKELKHYETKLAKDIKKATGTKKKT